MEPFTRLRAVAAPLDLSNVDTDQVIPARFLRKPRGPGYERWCFHDLRYGPGGEPLGFVLDAPPFDRAGVLVASRNFGVGSSREAAVYALLAKGLRCVVAESFGDIFHANALKNGLLPVRLPGPVVDGLRGAVAAAPGAEVEVDLEAQALTTPSGERHAFSVPPFARECMLRGLDEIGLTLTLLPEIEKHEARAGV